MTARQQKSPLDTFILQLDKKSLRSTLLYYRSTIKYNCPLLYYQHTFSSSTTGNRERRQSGTKIPLHRNYSVTLLHTIFQVATKKERSLGLYKFKNEFVTKIIL